MQAFSDFGINYYYVDIRLLDGYTYVDTISIKLSKQGCQNYYFQCVTDTEPCENRLKIKIDVNQCLDSPGVWNIEILNSASETIYNNIIQVHKNLS